MGFNCLFICLVFFLAVLFRKKITFVKSVNLKMGWEAAELTVIVYCCICLFEKQTILISL